MSDDDDVRRNGFEELLRAIGDEISRSVQRAQEADLDDIARVTGVDPERARQWMDEAGRWLRDAVEDLGSVSPFRDSRRGPAGASPPHKRPGDAAGRPTGGEDPLHAAGPHPLDLPTADQGTALAALESGRWAIEPGTSALTVRGDGPGPRDALGLVRELRVRDWIDGAGAVTLAGRHALERWLDAS